MVSATEKPITNAFRTLVFDYALSSSFKIPNSPWDKSRYFVCQNSFDGLVCLYDFFNSCFMINPTTGWYRPLPLCGLQHIIIGLRKSYYNLEHAIFAPGFGKDEFMGTYKPVWLYNSFEIGLENATTCEVFDFTTNAWRFITPSSPYRIVGGFPNPVFVDGSLYWFTDCKEPKVLSFDIHTENFQVVCKAPFVNHGHWDILLCNLDNRLCVTRRKWPNQVIWSFNSSNKTWDKLYSIHLHQTIFMYDLDLPTLCALSPIAVFLDGEKKKKKLLLYSHQKNDKLVIHDPETNSYDVAFSAKSIGSPVCYFQSLISIP